MKTIIRNKINDILAGCPSYREYFHSDEDFADPEEMRDVVADGQVQFFPHGSLLVEDNGVVIPVLAAYHSHKDVLLLDDLYGIAAPEQALRFALIYLAGRRQKSRGYDSASPVSLDDCILLTGRLELSDHRNDSGHQCTLSDFLDAAAHEAWQRDIQKMHAGSLAGAANLIEGQGDDRGHVDESGFARPRVVAVTDHLCLHCLNDGRPDSDWGELPKMLPHAVCPKCGRVTVDTSAAAFTGSAAFTGAVAAAVEEMKLAVLQDAAASLLRSAKKSGKMTR